MMIIGVSEVATDTDSGDDDDDYDDYYDSKRWKWANILLVMEQSALHLVQHSPRTRFPHDFHNVATIDIYRTMIL